MNSILNSNATIICKNIPSHINRFEITEIFNKYGPLLGEGICFGKKKSNMFFIKYKYFKDAIKAVQNLKNKNEYDFKLSLSKYDDLKYKALKGNKKAISELNNIYKKNGNNNQENSIIDINSILNESNEFLKKKKDEKEEKEEKKKDKFFILDLLSKTNESAENNKNNGLIQELKNYINLNCLCLYELDENNKYDNYLIPTFPN